MATLASTRLTALLTADERTPRALPRTATLVEAVDIFQTDTDLRLLPIVGDDHQPVGAIFEKDIRRLLLNPFGHALLRNPSIGGNLNDHLRGCPMIELTDNVGAIIEHYRRCDGREGMILTNDGRLWATLTNRRLLMLGAEHEHQAARGRLQRAQRIEASAAQFETRSGALASQMAGLANAVQRLAEATVDRSTIAGDRATSVGAAAVQTRDTLAYVAERGEGLAAAFQQMEQSVAQNRSVSQQTVARVGEGAERARSLLSAARSIDSVMALIGDIAGTVNLLSLNATIEAARAGDAGRGFAVVAGEIRKLSDETHDATQTITAEVRALKAGIELVAADYAEVEEAIAAMAGEAAQIDSAIAAEADSTMVLARCVAEAGQASVTIQEGLSTIVQSVRSASSSARELDRMANDLRSGASELGDSVSAFLGEVRAA